MKTLATLACVYFLWSQSPIPIECINGNCQSQPFERHWSFVRSFSTREDCDAALADRIEQIRFDAKILEGHFFAFGWVCLPGNVKPGKEVPVRKAIGTLHTLN